MKIRKNHLLNKNQDVKNNITSTLPSQINRDEFQDIEFATKVEYVNNTIPIELLGNEVDTKEHIGKVKNSSKNECVNQLILNHSILQNNNDILNNPFNYSLNDTRPGSLLHRKTVQGRYFSVAFSLF